MADEQTATQAPPASEAAAPREPAAPPESRSDSLADIREGLTARALNRDSAASDESEPRPDGEPGQQPSKPSEGSSRRQTAAQAKDAELAEARTAWERETAEKQQVQQRLEQIERERTGVVKRVMERRGDEQTFTQLQTKREAAFRGHGPELTYQEEEQLRAMVGERERWDDAAIAADLAVKAGWGQGLQAVAQKQGVDEQRLLKLPTYEALPYVYDSAYQAGEKAAEQRLKERIGQLEADNKALRTRTAAGPAPERGGRSAGVGDSDLPAYDAPASEQIAAGLRLRLRPAEAGRN